LGRLEAVDGERDLTPRRPKQRALLCVLLLRAAELVTVDELLEALWESRPPPAARNAVQGHVAALRRLLGRERIATHDGGYALRLEEDELDLHLFERLVGDARGRPPHEQVELLDRALALFRGAPLEDFRYAPFASVEAARIEELGLLARELRIDAELSLGRHDEVVPELERLVAEAPLRERLRAQLMLALYRCGRQADALAAYQHARQTLVDELGIEPGPDLQRLERQILNQDPALAVPDLAAGARLPTPPTPLLGRVRELADARELLLRDDVRLVTLTGPGGCGKTRLALEVARTAAAAFPGGTFFVGLAPLADAELVLPTLARGVGVSEAADVRLEESLVARLTGRPTLLLLDNFEHLLTGAPALGRLLSGAPALKLLVTSREALRLYGEHRFQVPALDAEAARALFLDRAEAVTAIVGRDDASLEIVDDICRRLDRLPLAIELAAARADALSLDELLARLGDRLELLTRGPVDHPPRQQTLRRTLEWSCQRLSAQERLLFARLSAFAGGWTLDAMGAVCGREDGVVGLLEALTDRSLVQPPPDDRAPRHTMLETIREYAAELLATSGEAGAVARRHVDYFLALAEEAEPHLRGAPGSWLDRLEREHDNLRAALDRLESAGEGERVQRLAGALWRFWYLRGHLTEGKRRLERALAAGDEPTSSRAKALLGATVMALNTGDRTTATVRAEEALRRHEALGDPWGAAYATFMLGNLAADRDHARRLYERSRRTFRELGDEHTELLVTRHLAFACEELGEHELARTLHEENLSRARETGNERIEASSLGALADDALDRGRPEEAVALLRDSLRAHREAGDVLDTSVDLCRLAAAVAALGDVETATKLLAGFEALGDQVGGRRAWTAELNERTLSLIHANLGDEVFAAAWAGGLELSLDEAVDLALAGAEAALEGRDTQRPSAAP
jgi:predicted ATPase/DNA-binding SARP family transcriptional activator